MRWSVHREHTSQPPDMPRSGTPRFAPAPPALKAPRTQPRRPRRRRALLITLGLMVGFAAIGGQLVRLGSQGGAAFTSARVEPLGRMAARPDIVDRKGRLIATDIEMHSLFADPSRVPDVDEAIEALRKVLDDLDEKALRKDLSDRSRRFVWVRRGLSPAKAQAIHEQGLPGFGFRSELRRVYPGGAGLGAIVGYVDIDNRGRAGIERFIDQQGAADAVFAPERSGREPVRLAIDLSVQAALADELQQALSRYAAKAAAGVVLDVRTGEVLASSSLPAYAAGDATAALDPALTDRMLGGTYELGSVFKVATLALASEAGIIEPGRTFDATQPITVGRFRIDDYKPKRRSLSAEEVFLYSSNLGAARMAEEAGDTLQRRLLTRLGLLEPMATEVGTLPAPQLPKNWGRIHTMTVAYGHGIALAPLQFAAGMAALVNGGQSVKPHFLRQDKAPQAASPVIGPATDQLVRRLMRLNVAHPEGTGGRAAVAGYDVGGKTGTADVPIAGGYSKDAAVTSFVAAFPMRAPRYLTYVVLFEPRPEAGVDRAATAGLNAAPTTARIIRRIAPMLGLAPQYDSDGS